VLAAGLSLLFPFNPREGLANLIELVFFAILYLLVLNTIDTPGKVWTVIGGWLLGASVAAGYGLYHYAMGTATTDYLAMNARRIVGTHMDPNFFGALLATSLVLCAALWQRGRGLPHRLAVTAGLAILATALILTLSRGALLGVGLGLLSLLVLAPSRARLALGVACALVAVWAARLPDYKSEHAVWSLRERVQQVALRGDPNQVNRLHGIYIAAVLFSEHPIVGSGLETFRERMAPYSSRFSLPSVYSCHTVPALLLAETGAIGFLLFNAFALLVLISTIRLTRAAPETESGVLARHLSAALVVLMVVGLTIAVLYSRFFWIAFAVADSLVLARMRAARDHQTVPEEAP
jgi:O-antigen ligase